MCLESAETLITRRTFGASSSGSFSSSAATLRIIGPLPALTIAIQFDASPRFFGSSTSRHSGLPHFSSNTPPESLLDSVHAVIRVCSLILDT